MKTTPLPVLKVAGPVIPQLQRPPPIREFQKAVLAYYRAHGRDLAWRHTTDPYRILVSEIMLQQTRVERVAVKYPLFTGRFPDFSSLASAPLPDVLLAWQGMGYNRRAISLQKCARRVVDEYNGTLPHNPDILETFPGIGRATAASIGAFAFNLPVVFIETNIRRVFIHYFFGDSGTVSDAEIIPHAKKALWQKDPRTWYNALMDLGTDLMMNVENPNRRSRQYTKQAPFGGSDRKIRGAVIRLLLADGELDEETIIRKLAENRDRVVRILEDLGNEGFLLRSGSGYSIASR
jgi:A/G-specific adenine glycosylase